MGIPKQVEEAAQMAEELMASQNSTDAEETEAEEQELEPEETTEEEPEEDILEEEEESDTQEDDEEESFRQKYQSLKGKYDAEVPKLSRELKELKQSVFERLGSYEQRVEQKPEEAPKIPEAVQKFIEEYGEEYADSLDAFIRYKMEPYIRDNVQPVQQQVAEFEETQIKTAQQNFVSYLDTQVKGDWKQLWSGADEGFIDFLQQPDPSGLYTYGDLVRLYNDNWEADRLAGIFNTYLESKAPPKETKKQKPVDDARISPNRRSVESTPKSDQKRIWTRDMIKEFELNDRKGMYSPEESKAMWDDLLMAPSENRIR